MLFSATHSPLRSLILESSPKELPIKGFSPLLIPPESLLVGDWTLSNPVTGGDLLVTLLMVPTETTTIYYSIDGAALVDSGGIGSFTISGLTDGVEYGIVLYAGNRHGLSQPSDEKAETPTAI